jgi:predicted alpha-1,2-mannosidase
MMVLHFKMPCFFVSYYDTLVSLFKNLLLYIAKLFVLFIFYAVALILFGIAFSYLCIHKDPLLSLVNRDVLGRTLQGWVNAYKEGGWLPKWASPGYRGGMLGTAADIVMGDAIVKGIPGFDVNTAFEAILKNAFVAPPEGVDGIGRVCLPAYMEFGHIPLGSNATTGGLCTEVVSRAQSYYQSDFAIASAAEVLGHSETAQILFARSQNYSKLLEPKTGFFRSRSLSTGEFTEPFDQYAWGGDYMESGPWQYRFTTPHDPMGLKQAFLKTDQSLDLCAVLEEMQTTAPIFHIGTFEGLIKEQTEMVMQCWGQYAHNDQPVHHVLYMFSAIDERGYQGSCAARGQYWLRRTLTEMYFPTDSMFPGDEDNGENGAWYVLSSLGLYSLSPGTSQYVFGSPLFQRVAITLDDSGSNNTTARQLVIIAKNNKPGNPYVQNVYWNDVLLSGSGIEYSRLMEGGILVFEMGSQPVTIP